MCNNIGNVPGIVTEDNSSRPEAGMQKKKQSATIQDVAKTAGVSVSTVSRVLNGKVDVAKETQDHILAVIEELGYTTNLAARSMRDLVKASGGLYRPPKRFRHW